MQFSVVHAAGDRFRPKGRSEEINASSPALPRLKQGQFGAAHHFFNRVPVIGNDRNSAIGGDTDLLSIHDERSSDRINDAMCQGRDRQRIRLIDQHGKLIASDPRDYSGRRRRPDSPPNFDEHCIADLVAERIVDVGKTVKIRENQDEWPPRSNGLVRR
jgi:hypothetical protein